MLLHPVSVKKNVQMCISPKLCLTPDIKSKYFRTGECVGIGQTTVPELKELSYQERLKALNLPTLYYRRMRYNLILLYKIISNIEDTNIIKFGLSL